MADEEERGRERQAWAKIFTCGFWLIVTVVFAVAVVFQFVLPYLPPSDPTPPCRRNLKKIGFAIANYASKYGRFPPAYTVDKQGRRMHSWRVLILEFLDPELCAQYDFEHPWYSAENLRFAKKMKRDGPYCCPNQEATDPTWTSYVMPVGQSAFSDGPHGRMYHEFTDGLSNTIMVVEMSPSGILWTSPYDLNVDEMSFKAGDVDHPGHRGHSGGASAVFADGHFRFLENTSDEDRAILKALLTINGGEDIDQLEKQRSVDDGANR